LRANRCERRQSEKYLGGLHESACRDETHEIEFPGRIRTANQIQRIFS
jgi:hypothetical protein